MLRIVLDSDEQYIVHDLTFFGEDSIGNPKTFYKGQQGLIEVPLPTWRFKVGPEEDGFEREKYVAGVQDLKIKYTIPFSEKSRCHHNNILNQKDFNTM